MDDVLIILAGGALLYLYGKGVQNNNPLTVVNQNQNTNNNTNTNTNTNQQPTNNVPSTPIITGGGDVITGGIDTAPIIYNPFPDVPIIYNPYPTQPPLAPPAVIVAPPDTSGNDNGGIQGSEPIYIPPETYYPPDIDIPVDSPIPIFYPPIYIPPETTEIDDIYRHRDYNTA